MITTHLESTRQQFLLERGRALERNVCDVDFAFFFEGLTQHVHGGARTCRAIVVLQRRVAAQQVGQLFQVFGGYAGAGRPDKRHIHGDRDPCKVGVHIEGGTVGQGLRHRGQRKRQVVHQDGVTIGGRFGHQVGTNRATRSAPVVDSDGLAHGVAHFLRHDAGNNVGGASCREWHDHLDGFAGVGLRQAHRVKRKSDQAQQARGANLAPFLR